MSKIKDTPEYVENHLNQLKVRDYQVYLDSTDWYYARKLEIAEAVPDDVVKKRIEARDFIRLCEKGRL